MTSLQQNICIHLFQGSYIIKMKPGSFRLRDQQHNPLRSFTDQTFDVLKKYLRPTRKGSYVIDLRKVRAARKNSAIKKYYLKLKSDISEQWVKIENVPEEEKIMLQPGGQVFVIIEHFNDKHKETKIRAEGTIKTFFKPFGTLVLEAKFDKQYSPLEE